jgi:hypothetical protein
VVTQVGIAIERRLVFPLTLIGFALTLVWVSNAIPRPPAKRSVAMGIVNGFGNIGNLLVIHSFTDNPFLTNAGDHGSVGSFVWKSQWGPDYHNSMYIGTGALVIATGLGLCAFIIPNSVLIHIGSNECVTVIRFMLIKENRKLDEDEQGALKGANRERLEQAAKLEGVTLEEAMERKKTFRYLY